MTKDEVTDITNYVYRGVRHPLLNQMMREYVYEVGQTGTYGEALEYYQKKFNTVIVTNKNNQFLKAFNYEENHNSPNGSSEKHCQECKSFGIKEDETL